MGVRIDRRRGACGGVGGICKVVSALSDLRSSDGLKISHIAKKTQGHQIRAQQACPCENLLEGPWPRVSEDAQR
jgi:hypothetical protein